MTQLGLDYPTAWGRGYRARLARYVIQRYLLTPYTRWMSTLEVHGLEHVEGPGPFIFAANHTTNLDTPLVLSALPDHIRRRTVVAAAMDNFFMDSRTAFRTVLVFNAIPVDRHKVNRRSSQLALELIEDHWNLLIYPEGGRSTDGRLQKFKGGAAYLAEHAKATVVPVYIDGAGLLRGPKYAKAPQYADGPTQKRHHVIVTFGPALHCEPDENIRRFNERIQQAVVDLGRQVTGDADYGVMPTGEG